MNLEFVVSELDRRLAGLIRYGVVVELDVVNAQVKVEVADIVTDWLPWLAARAGDDVAWWTPTVGEQVIVLCPSGELSMGLVLAGIYSDDKPANANSPDIHRITYSDGTVIEYDKSTHKATINCVGSVDVVAQEPVTVTAPSITINGNVTINGSLSTTGNISSGGNVSAVGALSGASLGAGGMSAAGGNVSSSGDIVAGGISLKNHVHGGVTPGGATTGASQ